MKLYGHPEPDGGAVPVPASAVATGRVAALLPGIALCGVIALLSVDLGRVPALASHGLSALAISVLLGMLLGNTVYPGAAAACRPGIDFSKQWLLRTGIVLFGFRLTFSDIAQLGVAGLVIDGLMIATTFVLAVVVGTRVLKLERTDAVLIGAGAAICGAAAVLATASVVRARNAQVTVAVATVVAFGTLAMFLYPLLHPLLAPAFAEHSASYGIFMGSTVHEVAQAIAAGSMVDPASANMSLVAKLGRVAMLGPFLLLLSAWHARTTAGESGTSRIAVPWFAVGFLAAAAFASVVPVSRVVEQAVNYASSLFLAMAMAALGLGAQMSVVRRAGAKPLLLAFLLAGWLLAGGLLINLVISSWR